MDGYELLIDSFDWRKIVKLVNVGSKMDSVRQEVYYQALLVLHNLGVKETPLCTKISRIEMFSNFCDAVKENKITKEREFEIKGVIIDIIIRVFYSSQKNKRTDVIEMFASSRFNFLELILLCFSPPIITNVIYIFYE